MVRSKTISLVLILTFACSASAVFRKAPAVPKQSCMLYLTGNPLLRTHLALRRIAWSLPHAFPDEQIEERDFVKVLNQYILPGLHFKTKLLLNVLVGPANMGKSTFLNGLPPLLSGRTEYRSSDLISPPGARPGTTLRPLILTGPQALDSPNLKDLRVRYRGLEAYGDPAVLKTAGAPLLFESPELEQYPEQAWADLPDLTSGIGDAQDGPVNLEPARNALLQADLFYVMIDDRNVFDNGLYKILVENNRRYGARESVIIMRGSAQTLEDEPGVQLQMIVDLARATYGLPAGTTLPPQVRGAYLMVNDDKAVGGKKQHPEYIALGGSKPLVQLIAENGEQTAEIKANGLIVASEPMRRELTARIATVTKARLAAQVYREALRSMVRELSLASTVDFPYDVAARAWREMFIASGKAKPKSVPVPPTTGATVVADDDTPIKQHKKAILFGELSPTYAQMNVGLQEQLQRTLTANVTAAWNLLKVGQVKLTAGPSSDRITKLLTEYYARYPEDRPPGYSPASVAAGSDAVVVTLPAASHLDRATGATWTKLIETPPATVVARLQRDPNGAFRAGLSAKKMAEYFSASVATSRSKKPDGKISAASGTVAATVTTYFHLFGLGLPGGAAVGAVTAGGVKAYRVWAMNTFLKEELNKLFVRDQARDHARVLEDLIVATVTTAMDGGRPGKWTHLDRIKRMLKTLDESYDPPPHEFAVAPLPPM